jgi:phosphoribosyl 1,2-cyclic phosphodiesterase
MRLIVIGSNSQGNCYLLENDNEALIIECGVRFAEVKKALKFNLSKVVGCIVTHNHLDHCKAAVEVVGAGINIYATVGTLKAIDGPVKGTKLFGHHRARPILEEKQFTVGNFRVIPFHVKHDVEQPVGFLINHPETGVVLFVTDTYYLPNTFTGLNNVIIEANFCQQIIDERLAAGCSPEFLRNRIFKSHMSLDTCKGVLQANDLSRVNNIVLIHLSDGNSSEERFQKEIAAMTGKKVHVATAGLVIENFNKQPF